MADLFSVVYGVSDSMDQHCKLEVFHMPSFQPLLFFMKDRLSPDSIH